MRESAEWPAGRLFFIKLLCSWPGEQGGVKGSSEAVATDRVVLVVEIEQRGGGAPYSCGHIKNIITMCFHLCTLQNRALTRAKM